MKVKEVEPHKITFQFVKPGTLFQDNSGQFYIKTSEGASLCLVSGHVADRHVHSAMVIPYPNAIILPQGEPR